MEVRKGYRQTDIGVLPKDWDCGLLDENSHRGSGHTPNKKIKEYYDGSIIWVSLADSDKLDRGYINSSTIKISKKGISNSSATLHPKGVVLMSRDAGIGKSAVAECDLCVSQHFITWFCNEKTLHNWFLYFWLQYQKKEFERIAMGSTIKTIGLPFFRQYKVPLPKYTEQTAIATALSDADALIASLEKLIAKKRNIKQGAMQELLKPKKGWEVKALGDVATFHKGRGLPKSYIKQNGKFKCIHYGELFTKYKENIEVILSSTDEIFDSLHSVSNDVLMPTSDVTPNGLATASCIKESGIILGGDILVIRLQKHIDGIFLAYFVSQNREQIMNLVSGSTVYHLYGSDMKKFKLSIPNLSEQIKIAEILTDMDSEIASLESKLAKNKMIKFGLMQNLLTGKIRLV